MNDVKWGYSGEEARKMTQQYDAQMQANKEMSRNRVDEFYLKEGESASLLFLDDLDFFYYRHVLPNGNGGYNNYTCLTEKGNCPLCKAGKSRSWVGCATVIDLTRSYPSKQHPGRIYKFKKLVIPAKGDSRNRLLYLRDNQAKGTLKFSILKFHRGATSKVSLGESIDYDKTVNMEWIKAFASKHLAPALSAYVGKDGKAPTIKEWLTPVDYCAAFPFLDPQKLASIAGVAYASGSQVGSVLDPLDELGGLASSDTGLESGFDAGLGGNDASGGIEDLL